jgi:hypothetical protein
MMTKKATFRNWLVHGSEAVSMPGYDLLAFIFGVLSVSLIFRVVLSAQAISIWAIAGLFAFVCLAGSFSYKAHTASNPDC